VHRHRLPRLAQQALDRLQSDATHVGLAGEHDAQVMGSEPRGRGCRGSVKDHVQLLDHHEPR
jgi:hypothetical protein